MRSRWPLLVTLLAAVGLAAHLAQAAGSDFPARLEALFRQLATYDLGGDPAVPRAAADLTVAVLHKPTERAALAARLANLLSANVPYGAKETACRQLSLIGVAPSVPALAALLPDAKLSYPARYALERIPDAAAETALLTALDKLRGPLRIGAINSLGARRSANAVVPLATLLHDADRPTAGAAAAALGRIGPPAAEALAKALATVKPDVRAATAAALVACARQLAEQGKRDQAAQLFDAVRNAQIDQASQTAAIHGAILARQAAGIPLLIEQLQAADARRFAVALSLARELPGKKVTLALAAGLSKLPAERQALLLTALADRGDVAALPAVLGLAKDGALAVRVAAIEALGRLGDASNVSWLAEQAAVDGPLATAAADCLANLRGKGVNEAILTRVEQGRGKASQTLVEILGRRRATVAVPALLRAAANAEPPVRLAAIKALGETAAMSDLGALAKLLLTAQGEQETAAVEAAIGALCARTSDKDACARVLMATLPQGSAAAKGVVLRALAQVGGAQALRAALAAVKDGNEEVRDAAIRVLAVWPDIAAAPELAALAKNASSAKQQILALRGLIRLAGLASVDDAQRLALCKQALQLAQRDDERKLALGAASGIQSPAALMLIVAQLEAPPLKTDAAAAAVALGERLAKRHPREVRVAMEKVVPATSNKNIVRRAQALLERVSNPK